MREQKKSKPFARKPNSSARTRPTRFATERSFKQPKPKIQTTTLWDFPSQHYGDDAQGDPQYIGVTPSYVIWNLVQRYTTPGQLVIDPMCGSGTTLDVAKDLNRQARGFDINPSRKDIEYADARTLPLKNQSVDFIFLDPPYSTHIQYSGHAKCIGELDAREGTYYEAMEAVISEMHRVLKDGSYAALYVSDSFSKGKPFAPLGFELFNRLCQRFIPVDIVAVVRHNKTMKRNHWHTSAIEGNYFLRGFNYLFILRKEPKQISESFNHERAGTLATAFKHALKEKGENEVLTPERFGQMLEKSQKGEK